jgi:hypothetical protein
VLCVQRDTCIWHYKGTNFLIKLPNFWAENFQINFIFLGIARSAKQIKTDYVCANNIEKKYAEI